MPGVLRVSVVGGTEDGRRDCDPLVLDCISPDVAETLFVKDDIAHPVQEAASLGCGVPILGAGVADASVVLGGGSTLSDIDAAYFRIRCR